MVHEGYQPLDRTGKLLHGYQLPVGWNDVPYLWAFDFVRPGAARGFRLQCGLQPQTRRMFIHACELAVGGEPVPDNIQVMGLQVDNYVRLGETQASGGDGNSDGSWQGVITSENTLRAMWEEYVAAPLWRRAEKAVAPGSGGGGGAGGQPAAGQGGALLQALHQHRHVLLPTAAVVAAAAAALLIYRRQNATV